MKVSSAAAVWALIQCSSHRAGVRRWNKAGRCGLGTPGAESSYGEGRWRVTPSRTSHRTHSNRSAWIKRTVAPVCVGGLCVGTACIYERAQIPALPSEGTWKFHAAASILQPDKRTFNDPDGLKNFSSRHWNNVYASFSWTWSGTNIINQEKIQLLPTGAAPALKPSVFCILET